MHSGGLDDSSWTSGPFCARCFQVDASVGGELLKMCWCFKVSGRVCVVCTALHCIPSPVEQHRVEGTASFFKLQHTEHPLVTSVLHVWQSVPLFLADHACFWRRKHANTCPLRWSPPQEFHQFLHEEVSNSRPEDSFFLTYHGIRSLLMFCLA